MKSNLVVLGLDVGEKRVGAAYGNFSVRIASPLAPMINDQKIFQKISALAGRIKATAIVIGLPRDISGSETGQAKIVRDFAARLAEEIDLQIILQDESLTSVLAEAKLRARKNFHELMLRNGTLDSEAAVLILQDFLERGGYGVL